MVLVKLIELYKSVLHEFFVTSALMNRKGLESTFTVLSAHSYQTFSPAISDIGIRFHLSSKKSLFRLTSNPCFNSHPSLIIFCCWDLIDVSLASEDANSKLVDVITVADFDDEECVGNSLVEILKLIFEASTFFQDFEAEVWPRFWGWKTVEILWPQNWSTFWARSLIKFRKLKFGRDSDPEFWPTCGMT